MAGQRRRGPLGTSEHGGQSVVRGRPERNFVAMDTATGKPLWHVDLAASVSNGPMTYELDGTQYVVVGAGDTLYGFAMLRK